MVVWWGIWSYSPTSTSIPTNQAPTTKVSQASPTTGTPTSPQSSPSELRSSDEAVYPLKSNGKESHRFRRYNHNDQHKQKPQETTPPITTVSPHPNTTAHTHTYLPVPSPKKRPQYSAKVKVLSQPHLYHTQLPFRKRCKQICPYP